MSTTADRARHRRWVGDEDRGIILPMTALMMVVLLGFTAFAVDLGILYNERRQNQSAADNGALSGGRVMIGNGAPDDIFADVARVTYANMGNTPITEGDWWHMLAGTNGEAECDDTGAADAGFPDALVLDDSVDVPGGGTVPDGTTVECITFDDAEDPTRMRVHLPVIEVEAVFAQVLGVDGYESSAFAEVGIYNPRDVGGVLPFAVAAASVSLAEICLKADSQGSLPQCDGGTTGNYGRLDLSVFGFLNAPEDCAGTGDADEPLAINTAQGLDHYLALSPTPIPSPIYTDATECMTDKDDDPNEADTQTGNAASGFNAGLIGFDGESVGSATLPTGLQGRLMGIHPSLDAAYDVGATNTVQVSDDGRAVEDVPLWFFLTPTLSPGTDLATTVPIRCLPETFDQFATQDELEDVLDAYPGLTAATYGGWTSGLTYPVDLATVDHLRGCFDDYKSGTLVPGIPPAGTPYTSVLFGKNTIVGDDYVDDDGVTHTVYDIEYSGRFGWMPVIWDETFPNGNSSVHFKEFQPIFIQTLFGNCTGNPKTCGFLYNPGEAFDPADRMANTDLGAASAMAIQLDMLPVDVQNAQQQKLLDDPPVRLMR
jgi:hypothetical protein